MKKLLAIAALSSVASAHAADFGVGANIGSDSSTIYAPINLSEGFRIEPYLSAYKSDYDNASYRRSELGAGFFKLEKTSNQTDVYWGARVGYIDGRDTDKEDFDGYSVAPVLGFEYFPVKNFSVGGEVAVEYNHLNSDSTNYFDNANATTTRGRVGIKFYFN